MKKAIRVAIIILTLYSVSCSSSRFTIINSSPFTFQVSNPNPNEDNDLGTLSVLHPLTVQSTKIPLDLTRKITLDYGSRLKLYLAVDVCQMKLEDVKHESIISYNYDSQQNILTIHPTDSNIDKFSFIVSSDPQPYRLAYDDGDPNSQRLLWFTCTVPVFNHIGQKETDAHLMIVNGDLTEFGRTTQWKTFQCAISGISIPMAYGLGNHDYQNNVEDCGDTDPIETQLYEYIGSTTFHDKGLSKSCSDLFPSVPPTFAASCQPALQKMKGEIEEAVNKYVSQHSPSRSPNLCARRMIKRMQNHIQRLAKVMWDFSSDEDSLAYAWNYGSILRFVQLHNHPGYTVKLKDTSAETLIIKPSYDWLIADMNAHKDRSYILNVHDAVDNSDLEVLRPYFGRIKAIFAGHSHEAGVKCMKKIAIFDSGALFKNEFLRVNFAEGGRCFNVLHFVEDKYVSPLAEHYCFQSVLENPC